MIVSNERELTQQVLRVMEQTPDPRLRETITSRICSRTLPPVPSIAHIIDTAGGMPRASPEEPLFSYTDQAFSNLSKAARAAASCSAGDGASAPNFSFSSTTNGRSSRGAVFSRAIAAFQSIVPS